jgi:hypothetical protein
MHAHRSKVATLLSRVIAGITADVLQLAGRLQGSERLLRREVEEYRKDPSAGASKGLCSIKVGGFPCMVPCMLHEFPFKCTCVQQLHTLCGKPCIVLQHIVVMVIKV